MKYPNKVRTAIKQKQDIIRTCTVDAYMLPPRDFETEGDKKSPYEVFSCYSRFVFSILEKQNGNTKSVKANIPPEDVDFIWHNTLTCEQMGLFSKGTLAKKIMSMTDKKDVTDDEVDRSTAGFTIPIGNGKFKGKYPCNILIEDASQKGALLSQRDWLAKNIAKYPNNQKQINAIDDAIMRLENGMLGDSVDKSDSNEPIPIYMVDIKIPNPKKKEDDGTTFVYSIKITYNPNMNNPVCLEIANWMCPVNEVNGKVNAVLDKATVSLKKNFLFTMEEWHRFIYDIHRLTENFGILRFGTNHKTVKAHEYNPDNH